jgi:hypothetical protein
METKKMIKGQATKIRAVRCIGEKADDMCEKHD